MASENEATRVRFGNGDTDTMLLPQAEYVLMRFYRKNRRIFAGHMAAYYLDQEGGPGADRERSEPVPGRGPGRPRAVPSGGPPPPAAEG